MPSWLRLIENSDDAIICKDLNGIIRVEVALTVSPVKDASGKIIGASKIARNITERKRSAEAQRFLAETSSVLSSSLDYERTLASIAQMAVPGLADWCTVDMPDENGALKRLAVAHVEPSKVAWAHELEERFLIDMDAPHVLRTGESELYPDIPDALLVEAVKDEEQLRLLRSIGFSSAMIVPLIAKRQPHGINEPRLKNCCIRRGLETLKKQLASAFFLSIFLCVAGNCPAQSPREGYIKTADGVRLFYKVVGSGAETLVAVHGGPGNSLNSILPDLEPLAKNRTVIYYDQRGNGRSDLIKDRDKLAIARHIEDLETVRRYFKLDKMVLLGNSWGGMLISFYAAAHPDRIERMILHDPGEPTKAFATETVEEIQQRLDQRYDAVQRKRFAFLSNPQTWVKAEDPRAICREWFQMLAPTYVANPESMAKFKGDVCSGSEEAVRYQQFVNMQIWDSLGDFNVLPSLGAVKAPVLIIHGAADPIPIESSEAWATAFPNARLLLIKGAGHISHVEQPEIFFKAVETFLHGSFPVEAKKVQTSTEKN